MGGGKRMAKGSREIPGNQEGVETPGGFNKPKLRCICFRGRLGQGGGGKLGRYLGDHSEKAVQKLNSLVTHYHGGAS